MRDPAKKIPLYLFTDSTVPDDLRGWVAEGVRDFSRYVPGLTLVRKESEFWNDGIGKVFADGVQRSLTAEGKLLAKEMLTALDEGSKGWKGMGQGAEAAGAVIYITMKDLTVPKMTVCFGLTRVKARVSVNSMSRFTNVKDRQSAALCVRRTVVHELGHMFGAPAPNRVIAAVEDFGKHCTDPDCVMCQTPNLDRLLEAAQREYRNDELFCSRCRRDIRRFLRDRGYR